MLGGPKEPDLMLLDIEQEVLVLGVRTLGLCTRRLQPVRLRTRRLLPDRLRTRRLQPVRLIGRPLRQAEYSREGPKACRVLARS